MFGSCKIFFRNAIFRKGKYFPMFSCIPNYFLESIFWCLVVFLKMLWKTQFYHVSHIFLHFLSFQTSISSTPTKSKFIKTQILNTEQKKIHQIRDQPKIREQQNKKHPRHHNNNKKIRDQREQADWWRNRPRASKSAIRQDDLRFDEWCDDFWVCDNRWRMGLTIFGFVIWGMGSTARSLSLSLCLRVWVLPSLSLSLFLSLFAHCSMNKLGLGFSGLVRALGCGSILPSSVLGCWCDLSSVLSLFLSSIFLGRKWFEVKMRTEIIFRPSQPYFTIKLKTFSVWLNF